VTGDTDFIEIEERDVRQRLVDDFLDKVKRSWSLNLEAEVLRWPFPDSAVFVPRRRSVVVARLKMVLDPIDRAVANEIEFVLVEIEQDTIADEISIFVTRNQLLCLSWPKPFEAVSSQIGEQLKRVGSLHIEVSHVM